MNSKIWIALVALALGAAPAGEPQAQPNGPGSTAPAHGAITNRVTNELRPGLRLAGEPAEVSPEPNRQALEAYGRLPLTFVPNAGQANAHIRLYAQGSGFRFAFLRGEAIFTFTKTAEGKARGAAIALRFLDARPQAEPQGQRPATGRVNYLIGSDPTRWRTNLPTYEEVLYRDLWPGIDLVFRGAEGKLKYEFVVRPGAEVSDIRLGYRGAESLSLDRAGNLLVKTPLGTLTDASPFAYQQFGDRQVAVGARYVLVGRDRYRFAIAAYDRRQPMVIDPGLAYSTFLGGSGSDGAFGIAVDGAGNAYVTGPTSSADFPTTPGAFQTTFRETRDVFVTKLNSAGTALVYSTYLGGGNEEHSFGIAIDGAGSAYVTGWTASPDFPTTVGAFDIGFGSIDAFVTKLDPSGTALAYSTYLGGSNSDQGLAIALDGAGSAHVTGSTVSSDFPTTPGAVDTTFAGVTWDAFVTKLDPLGTSLMYSSYLGGADIDEGRGIAIDAGGSAHVTGATASAGYPTTAAAFDVTFDGSFDAFLTKLDSLGSLVYSTYLGGSANDQGWGIAVDSTDNAYVAGTTSSPTFPTTPGAFDTTINGAADGFVTKVHPGGTALLYSTYLGGSGGDQPRGIVVDDANNAYITGGTESSDFPTTPGAFDTTFNGVLDTFATKLDPSGTAVVYSTYLGGSNLEEGSGISLDAASNAYIAGTTASTDFPITQAAFDATFNGGPNDAFVTKLDMVGAPPTVVLTPVAATNPLGTNHTVTANVSAGGQPVSGFLVQFTVTGANMASGSCTTGPDGQCTFSYTGTQAGTDAIEAYADSDNDDVQDPGEPTGAATKVWTPPTAGCPPNGGDDDEDDDGLEDNDESLFGTLLGNFDSDRDGEKDGNDDSDGDGRDDEDEDDGTDDECPNDSDGDGEDDEDEDDDGDEDEDDKD